MSNGVRIEGVGSFAPEQVVTNFDLEARLDTNDEWIRTRTGIEARHIAADDVPTSELAAEAALKALDDAGRKPEDVDLIIVATISPDEPFPNTASHVQRRIGAVNAACFGLEAACTGFVYGLEVGANMVRGGNFNCVLVIGAEKMSSIVDWSDRTTCVLFGDGAGAAVLVPCPVEQDALISSKLKSDGRHTQILHTPAGGSALPITNELLEEHANFLKMEGQSVFKLAVTSMVKVCKEVLKNADLTLDQVKWIIPHQANTRIINAVGKGLGAAAEQVYVNVNRYGNTSSASVPIALDEIVKGDLVKRGDYILLVAFGGGLTWGASLLKW